MDADLRRQLLHNTGAMLVFAALWAAIVAGIVLAEMPGTSKARQPFQTYGSDYNDLAF